MIPSRTIFYCTSLHWEFISKWTNHELLGWGGVAWLLLFLERNGWRRGEWAQILVVPLCRYARVNPASVRLQPACDSAQVSHRDSVVTRWFMLLCPFRRQYEYDHIPAFNAVLQGRCLCACKKGNFEARDCFCRWFWLPGATPCGHVQCGESFEGDGVKSVSEAAGCKRCL